MKILIIDDDLSIVKSLDKALTRIGYECTGFLNPAEALDAYKNKCDNTACDSFDVVITDIRMKEMNGLDLISKIYDYDDKAYIIVISAFEDFYDASNSIKDRVYAYFKKPVDFEDLVNKLNMIKGKDYIYGKDIHKKEADTGNNEEIK